MEQATLGKALELEHRQIDGAIEAYLAAADGEAADPAPLRTALAGLRRHIYLEEQFLFPPLQAAGLMGPIFVMLREHGALWRAMDAVEALPPSPFGTAAIREACTALLVLLDAHNSKEEPIIYAQADKILDAAASAELLDFLAQGTAPGGWVCAAV